MRSFWKWLSILLLGPLFLLGFGTVGGNPPSGGGNDGGGEGEDTATGDPPGAGKPPKGDEIKFTPEQQAYIDKLVGGARTKAREQAKAEIKAEREKAAAEAEKKRLAEQAEWQKLAEKHAADLAAEQARRRELSAEYDAYRLRTAVVEAAAALNFGNPADAYELLTADGALASIEFDDDGKVSGFEKALEDLAKSGRLPMKDAARSGFGTPTRRPQRPREPAQPPARRRIIPL